MSRQKVLENILAITTGFLVLYSLSHFRIFLYISMLSGLIGLFIPLLATLIARAWRLLGIMLGNIVSRIVLSLVFLFMILQALLYRLFRQKGPLDKPENESYYHLRNHEYKSSDLDKLW